MPTRSRARRSSPMTPRKNCPMMATVRKVAEKAIREEAAKSTEALNEFAERVFKTLNEFVGWQRGQFDELTEQIRHLVQCNQRQLHEMRQVVNAKFKAVQAENAKQLQRLGESLIQAGQAAGKNTES